MVQRLHKTSRLLVLSGLRRTEEKKREVLGLAECRASELLRPSLDFVYIEILLYSRQETVDALAPHSACSSAFLAHVVVNS